MLEMFKMEKPTIYQDSIVKEEDYYVIDDSQVVQQIWERLARLEGFVGGNGLDVYWIVLE